MKEKFQKLSRWSFGLALVIFISAYFLYHYVTPEGAISLVYRQEPGKPFITQLWANLGVLFLFGGIFCQMIAKIFYSDKS